MSKKISWLFIIFAALAQAQTICQITSYYGQEVQCPQMKDSSYQYTIPEIVNICSSCQSTTPTFAYCCPQNYQIAYNRSDVSCICNGNSSQVQCVNCGYSQVIVDAYCQNTVPTISDTFAGRTWACPPNQGAPTSGVSGWTCLCGRNGYPCVGCASSEALEALEAPVAALLIPYFLCIMFL